MERSKPEQELFEKKIEETFIRNNREVIRMTKTICGAVKEQCKTGTEALEMLSGLQAESQMKLQRVDALIYEEAGKILQAEINNRLL